MSNLPEQPAESWVQVASPFGTLETEVLAGMLRAYDIPVYVEPAGNTLSVSAFGGLIQFLIFVPESYVEAALLLLEEDTPPSLDSPPLQL